MVIHGYSKLLLFIVLALTGLMLFATSCAKTVPVHPGAANPFDSSVYDALVTIQGGIEQAKIGVTDAKKPLLNKIIAGYNAAEAAYTDYHKAALAGTATPAQQSALQLQVTEIKAQLAALGGK